MFVRRDSLSGTVRSDTLQAVDSYKDQNIFVIRGAADNAVSVSSPKQMVEKLTALTLALGRSIEQYTPTPVVVAVECILFVLVALWRFNQDEF